MVKKLMLVTSLLTFSSTIVSTAEAMQTPPRNNRINQTPEAPRKVRQFPDQGGNQYVPRRPDFNGVDDDDTVDY